MIPTEEEKQRIQEAQLVNPDIPLGSAEQFLLTLSSITELSARLQLWAFKMDYELIEKVRHIPVPSNRTSHFEQLHKYFSSFFLFFFVSLTFLEIHSFGFSHGRYIYAIVNIKWQPDRKQTEPSTNRIEQTLNLSSCCVMLLASNSHTQLAKLIVLGLSVAIGLWSHKKQPAAVVPKICAFLYHWTHWNITI